MSTGAYSVTEVKLLLTATHTSRLGGKHCKEFLARRQLVRSRLDWFAKLLPLHLSLHSVKCNVIEMSLGIGRIGNCLFLHLSHQCRETRCCTKFLQSNNWYLSIYMKLENWIYSNQKRDKSSDEIQLTVCKEVLQHTNIFRCMYASLCTIPIFQFGW